MTRHVLKIDLETCVYEERPQTALNCNNLKSYIVNKKAKQIRNKETTWSTIAHALSRQDVLINSEVHLFFFFPVLFRLVFRPPWKRNKQGLVSSDGLNVE